MHLCSSFVAVALACSASASAGTVTSIDTFTGGVNAGGWSYGPPPSFPSTGGNPGAFLGAMNLSSFAPDLRTTAATSPFLGDWRQSLVTSFGVDLKVFSEQFGVQRECTLVLHGGGCIVYFLGTSLIPPAGAPWKSFDFDVPTQSTTMPAGWAIHPASTCTNDDAAWNAVITNVTAVEIFYGNPLFFYPSDVFKVGADNARITRQDGWTDLGHALGGSLGFPVLAGTGIVSAGQPITVSLTSALPNTTVFLLTGLTEIDQPFFGGILVPDVSTTNLVLVLSTDPAGAITIPATWPATAPVGTDVYLQCWIPDPAGPVGAAASNGLRGATH